MPEALTADEARRLCLRAQGLLGVPDRRAGVSGVVRRLGAVQLDTVSVLARSHELVPCARLGPVGRAAVEAAYWGSPHRCFEYWAHAASILPMEDWPWFASRRGRRRSSGWQREVARRAGDEVLARLRSEGPLTATQLGGARRGGPWWDWSDAKLAVERLLDDGTVVCVERRGWKRVYDLAERAIPVELLAIEPSDEECHTQLVALAGRHLGVATREDLADYYRLKLAWVDEVVDGTGLVPVEVAGWEAPAWADPEALAVLSAGGPRGRHRSTLLSPFDSLIWHRQRTERVFGFRYRIEIYVPKAKRVHGYFVMPVLAGGRLVARVDPARSGRTLVARQVSVDRPSAVGAVGRALMEAAAWVGCDTVGVERVDPPELAEPLRAAVA